MILRPNTDWHTDEIDAAIAARRKAEGVWRSSNLTVHHQIFREKCTTVTNIIRKAKRDFYSRKVSDAESDQKTLFTLSQTMMNKNRHMFLPTNINKDEIADKFAVFFRDKLAKIRSDLDKKTPSIQNEVSHTAIKIKENTLNQFQPPSVDEVKKIIMSSTSKSCSLDPSPTNLQKQCVDILSPIITDIVNVNCQRLHTFINERSNCHTTS